ncbi:MAG: hypothetical protein KJ850_03230 [Gammaproteobacteria bacterium]|nr:hypothetical protein [Gammaproteobacteria bacterium]MBU1624039.1 hypothetical protein [Gammaproteobacteria bacterium]MBU1981767.1 hypothetical protein [Gammaproteobacteria bacterium]
MSRTALHVLVGNRKLDTYPSVYNAMHILAERGWKNQIITSCGIEGFEHLVQRHYCFSGGYMKRARQLSCIADSFGLAILYEPRDVEILQLSRWLGGRLHAECLVHHSLEIPTDQVSIPLWKRLAHRVLYRGYRLVDRLIIQDVDRYRLLVKHVPAMADLPRKYVPNAYLADMEPMAASLPWFDVLRKRSQCIVTYTGALERWALSPELFMAIRELKDVGFVFSGWSEDGFAEEAMALCRGASHIHFDLGHKGRAEFNYMVSHSDIGLVFYDSADPNIAEMGLSSGKLHKFLSYGKPVLSNEVPTLKQFLEGNGFGLAVEPKLIPAAIRKLVQEHDRFSTNVATGYPALVNFRTSYGEFIESLDSGLGK